MITATATLGGTISVTAQIASTQTGSCADADWELQDTAGSTLDSGSIASGDSDIIEAPDAAFTVKNSVGDTLAGANVKSGGSVNVVLGDVEHTQTDGSPEFQPVNEERCPGEDTVTCAP